MVNGLLGIKPVPEPLIQIKEFRIAIHLLYRNEPYRVVKFVDVDFLQRFMVK